MSSSSRILAAVSALALAAATAAPLAGAADNGHQEVTRTVELQKNTRESAVMKQLGY
jgi:hypothetical protein